MTQTDIEIPLKYGLNPAQSIARLLAPSDASGVTPLNVRNGRPSFINALDALRGWQLVRELKSATGLPAATSFKHVSPAGAAVANPIDGQPTATLTDAFRRAQFIHPELALSPVAIAYAKARSADRGASFGDFIAVSEPVDISLANLIRPEVSDGLIAPGFEPGALEILAAKKGGNYVMFEIDPSFDPYAESGAATLARRTEFGLTLEQSADLDPIDDGIYDKIVTTNQELSAEQRLTGLVATIALRHTQSNSVCVAFDGAAIGIGAGQQSRIACTRLACDKADLWCLRQHPDIVDLKFATGLTRSERVNAADLLTRSWLQSGIHGNLAPAERATLSRALGLGQGDALPNLGTNEAVVWLSSFKNGVISSDAFFPFRDNLDRAAASRVGLVIQAGGSARDQDVTDAANEHGMAMCHTGRRFFLH